MGEIKKVVLAYSGGLDTSVIVKWLQDKYGCEVITYTADLGQNEDLEPIKEKALKVGASKAYVEDVREEFLNEYVMKAFKFGALYEGKYPLATALGRPLITKKMIEIAQKEGADAIAHGSTGKGNDQVRFDVSAVALKPDIKVIAPVRDWELKSRDEEIEYAKKHGIPVPVTKDKPYSIDRNIWGLSVEAGPLEDPYHEPDEEIYSFTKNPLEAPDEPEYVEIEFEKGIPVAIDGKRLNIVDLVNKANEIAGRHGVGRIDMVENRLVGIKSREIYEAPAAVLLLEAKRSLDELILDRESLHLRDQLAIKYAELVYYGYWFCELREALDAFADKLNERATGTVKVKLYKGKATAVARKSPYAIYSKELATYDPGDTFNHKYGEAFCYIWGLPLRVAAEVKNK
ncbi:argininosuccinate synthase [Hippea maritima]|uniref:Argininosuccinate synthase n=1 Tax=Hippea maritima (strain ATCC 700847 / DSM 10411 / MH2) TaxID=760142 RepID=F2LX42_HIPMA|nr:argininosuccinate synthase [Hippea maritima]AEA33100.1 Argininosuccinate synthase [Hippea maritima DSM 10411]